MSVCPFKHMSTVYPLFRNACFRDLESQFALIARTHPYKQRYPYSNHLLLPVGSLSTTPSASFFTNPPPQLPGLTVIPTRLLTYFFHFNHSENNTGVLIPGPGFTGTRVCALCGAHPQFLPSPSLQLGLGVLIGQAKWCAAGRGCRTCHNNQITVKALTGETRCFAWLVHRSQSFPVPILARSSRSISYIAALHPHRRLESWFLHFWGTFISCTTLQVTSV